MKNTKLFRVFVLMLALAACVCMLFAGCTGTDEPDNSDTSSSQDGSTDASVPDSGTGDSTGDSGTGDSTGDSGTGDSTDPGTGDSTIPSTGDSTGSDEKPDVPCSHKGGTATCTAQAVCEDCGQAYGELAEHTMVAGETVAPTCEAAGYTVYGCENCDATEERDQVEALGGECDWYFVGYSAEDRPMCGVKGGTELYVCGNCEATKEVAQEAMHDFSCRMNVVEGKEPTCTEAGYAWYECMGCVEGVERKIPAAHTYDSPTDVINATCTTGGSQTWICTVCEDVYVETSSANGHNQKWDYDETTATCTEAGVEKYGCWNCDEIIEVEVEAYGHSWSLDESTLDLEKHSITRTCDACSTSEQISSYGMEADPIPMTVPGSFTASVTGEWTYYSFKQTSEGYLTFTFDTDNVNVIVKDANDPYNAQYFWGGETTFVAEIFADGVYTIGIASDDDSAIDIAVTVAFEEADVPAEGETAEKAIIIDGTNTAYTVNGKYWYKFEAPMAGKLTVDMISGEATSIKYGVSAEELSDYAEGFDVSEEYTIYYFLIETDAEAEFVINIEAEKGSMENPYDLTIGENAVQAGGWYFLPVYSAGTFTFTVESTDYTFSYGGHPYQVGMYGGALTYTDDANPMMLYFGGYYFKFDQEMNFTVAFSEVAPEPVKPEVEIGEIIDSMDVETTDTYGYFDEYSFVAKDAGQYTFYVPAGLGFWDAEAKEENPFAGPAIDFYDNEVGSYVTVNLEAGASYSFLIGALEKNTWTIDVYFYVEESVENAPAI